MKKGMTLLMLFLGICLAYAETSFHTPDKVYLHLDRNLYAQGDTIWIKAYAMERGSNKPSDKSNAIHVQMLNEDGKQVGAYKLLTVNGEALGQIEILGVQAPGFYQLVAHTGYMKNFSERFFFKTTIEIREKVRRRTVSALFDKSNYNPGDTAKVTFSVTDHNQSPVEKARFVYTYLNGNEQISKNGVTCDEEGSMTVRLIIPQEGNLDHLKLDVSYFASDLDAHRMYQEVPVPVRNKRIHLSFYPEGGDMIAGLMTKLAFRAHNAYGKPVDVAGELYLNGHKQANCESMHDGMGLVSIMPQQGTYTFKLTSPQGYDSIYYLPEVKAQGYRLSYIGQNDEKLYLAIAKNADQGEACTLWVSHCDELINTYHLSLNEHLRLPLEKSDLPAGIVTFTLSDDKGVPQAERLVYIEKESPELDISLSQITCEPREKVVLKVESKGPNGRFSMAVVDSVWANSPAFDVASIKAYAEFASELNGPIHHINDYLSNDSLFSEKRDLLLLTHGWRRFEWMDNNRVLSTMKVHNFNRVIGQVERLGKPYPQANIGAYLLGNSIAFSNFKSDDAGRFFLDPQYENFDYKDIIIVASNKKGRMGVDLTIYDTDTVAYKQALKNNAEGLKHIRQATIQEESDEPKVVGVPFMSYNTYELQEFEVSAERQTWDMTKYMKQTREVKMGIDLEPFESFSWLLEQVSNEIILEGEMYHGSLEIDPHDDSNDPMPNPIVKADRAVVNTHCADRVDVLDITTCNSHRMDEIGLVFDSIHNRPGALLYLNDEYVGYFLSSLDFLRKDDILSVVVLDGVEGLERFGIGAYYGAILVYTHDKNIWSEHRLKSNKALFGHFVKARRFPAQLYDTELQRKTTGDDNRVTLHWEPMLHTNANGQVETSFYTSDLPGKKLVLVQGFDEEGNLYFETARFEVKDIMAP